MRLGIDASNIRAGGGMTHLVELLDAASPKEYGFHKVIVWGGEKVAQNIKKKDWLEIIHVPSLDGSMIQRAAWQHFKLGGLAVEKASNLLFAPGGTYSGHFRPFVSFSQNLLPFDAAEQKRFGLTPPRFRYALLKYAQASTFRKSQGVIFLSKITHKVVERQTGGLSGHVSIIPHGVSDVFRRQPREQKPLAAFSCESPLRITYVSIVNFYKHQWHVVEAVATLRQTGYPIVLDLIGPAYPPALKVLQKAMQEFDPSGEFVRYQGPIPYSQLIAQYCATDVFVFASSCETFGMILLEAMAAGLPIACSNRSAMPEILQEAGVYFDPEQPEQIAAALRTLLDDEQLRQEYAWAAYERAQEYTWERCAHETLSFFAKVARTFRQK